MVVCIGSKINIPATVKGGNWLVDNIHIALVDAENGIVTGMETGRTIVSYTVSDGWNTTISLTEVQVNPIPDELIISASTARVVSPGQRASFAAAITNGGTNPVYQWQMNGVDVAGANSPIFVTNNISGYTEVTCIAGSSAGCSGHSLSKTYTVNAANSAANQSIAEVNISLLPNPNKGDFYLRGTVGITNIENLTVEVTNMLGQVVYSAGLKNTNGNINEEIHLGNRLVNGNYLLNLKINSANQVFHFVVEQ